MLKLFNKIYKFAAQELCKNPVRMLCFVIIVVFVILNCAVLKDYTHDFRFVPNAMRFTPEKRMTFNPDKLIKGNIFPNLENQHYRYWPFFNRTVILWESVSFYICDFFNFKYLADRYEFRIRVFLLLLLILSYIFCYKLLYLITSNSLISMAGTALLSLQVHFQYAIIRVTPLQFTQLFFILTVYCYLKSLNSKNLNYLFVALILNLINTNSHGSFVFIFIFFIFNEVFTAALKKIDLSLFKQRFIFILLFIFIIGLFWILPANAIEGQYEVDKLDNSLDMLWFYFALWAVDPLFLIVYVSSIIIFIYIMFKPNWRKHLTPLDNLLFSLTLLYPVIIAFLPNSKAVRFYQVPYLASIILIVSIISIIVKNTVFKINKIAVVFAIMLMLFISLIQAFSLKKMHNTHISHLKWLEELGINNKEVVEVLDEKNKLPKADLINFAIRDPNSKKWIIVRTKKYEVICAKRFKSIKYLLINDYRLNEIKNDLKLKHIEIIDSKNLRVRDRIFEFSSKYGISGFYKPSKYGSFKRNYLASEKYHIIEKDQICPKNSEY